VAARLAHDTKEMTLVLLFSPTDGQVHCKGPGFEV